MGVERVGVVGPFSSWQNGRNPNIKRRTMRQVKAMSDILGIQAQAPFDLPVYSVTDITRLLKRYLEDEPLFRAVTISGEISNFKHHTSGHMYFGLKDAQSSIRCVMFRGRNSNLRFTPTNGLEVYATGGITIYEPGGVYQLYVDHLEPRGIGDLHLAFQQLKDKLAREGLFDPGRKRPLPFLPRRIGVVTSPTGAAIQDIISVLTRRAPSTEILVAPALVQGREAAMSIVDALEALIQYGEVDVIIVGRGGGSLEDLWPFNEEIVARAVYGSPVPVISAVGHETDVTICDLVADVRAPTPSGAAELAVPLTADLLNSLVEQESRLLALWQQCFRSKRDRISHLERMLGSYNPTNSIKQHRQRLDELSQRMVTFMERELTLGRTKLSSAVQRLDSLSPLAVVGRGYAIVSKRESREPVVSVEDVEPGSYIEVMLQDGTIQAEVKDTKLSTILGTDDLHGLGPNGK